MGDTGYEVHIYKDEAGEWRWRRVAGNNRIVAVSGEGYENKDHAVEQAREFFPDDEFGLIRDSILTDIPLDLDGE